MDRKDIVMVSPEELRRVSLINQAIGGSITQVKAADVIGLSYRQTKRLVARVREEGDTGIIHKSRGRPGSRRIDDEVKDKVIRLYNEKYQGFKPTFAAEKLCEVDKIEIGHDTLRRWLLATDKDRFNWQRKARPHRQWRQRKDCFGEMIQMDGSHHDWLEGRGPWLVLMGYIDDATGITFGRFYDYEGIMPAMDSLMRYIEKYGIPQSIYIDKYDTYKSPKKPTIEEQLRNEFPLTQFGRAVKEIGIRLIYANSPQAKGRVERGFGTHQDRLVKEMRLAGINTKNEANEFLGWYFRKHNKKFSVSPAEEANLHGKSPGKKELKRILCIWTDRSLRNDAVVRHNNGFYQIENLPRKRIKTVTVEDRLDGSVHIRYNKFYLRYRQIDPALIPEPAARKQEAKKPRKVYIPPKDHPWKQFSFGHSSDTADWQQKEEELLALTP